MVKSVFLLKPSSLRGRDSCSIPIQLALGKVIIAQSVVGEVVDIALIRICPLDLVMVELAHLISEVL